MMDLHPISVRYSPFVTWKRFSKYSRLILSGLVNHGVGEHLQGSTQDIRNPAEIQPNAYNRTYRPKIQSKSSQIQSKSSQ